MVAAGHFKLAVMQVSGAILPVRAEWSPAHLPPYRSETDRSQGTTVPADGSRQSQHLTRDRHPIHPFARSLAPMRPEPSSAS